MWAAWSSVTVVSSVQYSSTWHFIFVFYFSHKIVAFFAALINTVIHSLVLASSLTTATVYSTSVDNRHKLLVMQNALARLVCQVTRTCSATEVRHTRHWLPVKQCIDYKLTILTFKAKQSWTYLASLISNYIPDRSLISLDKLMLRCPYTFLVVAEKVFFVSASKIRNELSFSRRAAPSVHSFQCRLKHQLFAPAYADQCH